MSPKSEGMKFDKGCDMHTQSFASLSLCTNKPYWLLHQGCCEHFIVLDQIRLVCRSLHILYLHLSHSPTHISFYILLLNTISHILAHMRRLHPIPTNRLLHKSDPSTGYPFALHIAPPVLDLCQACSRAPASLSIVGDIRLAQTPCKLCGPCWREMGKPVPAGEVKVVPLRKFQIGW